MNFAKTPAHVAEALPPAASGRRGFLGWMSMTALVGSVLLGTARHASAATVTVSNTTDVVDGDTSSIANLIATPGPDGISLREAVQATENTPGSDTILFAPTVTGSIALGSQLSIRDYTVITGPGAANLALDGGDGTRIFDLPAFYYAGFYNARDVSISGLTLKNGYSTSTGGAIRAGYYRSLTLDGCTVSGNYAIGAGGAIYGNYSDITITNSTLSSNRTRRDGGAIALYRGQLDLTGTVISQNSGDSGGGVSLYSASLYGSTSTFDQNTANDYGGGIFANNSSYVVLDSCTISNNEGYYGGGGIAVYDRSSTLHLTQCTISGNKSIKGDGAGIRTSSAANLYGCTITQNDAGGGAGGVLFNPGRGLATLNLTNTIISGNSATDLNRRSGFVTARNSLLSRVDGYVRNYYSILGAVARLTPLGDYGGPTQTHLLLPGSPGLDAGSVTGATVDQRGTGFPRQVGAAVDIGATEGVASIPIVAAVSAPTVTGLSTPTQYDFTLTFADDTGIDVSSLGNGNVRVTGPGGYSQLAVLVSVDDSANGTPRIATYRIVPPGGTWNAAANGTYNIAVEANQVRDISGNFAHAKQVGSFEVGLGAAFVVKNLNDAGPDSLRDCIGRANGNGNSPAVDVITFSPGLAGTITLATGRMDIYAPVQIAGPGASVVTVSGDTSSSILNANGGYYDPLVVGISGLTLSGAAGSAVYLYNTNTSIQNVVFSGNSGSSGGAMRIEQSTVSIAGASFNGNNARYDGGALFADNGSEVTVADTAFTGNSALYYGGGIALEDSSLVLSRSTLVNNTAADGGGIALDDSSASVSAATFSGNSATDTGGGIYGNFAGMAIERSTFSGNTAQTGGVLNSYSGQVQIQNSTFSGNSAKDGGGAITLGRPSATIRNSTFSGNMADSDNNASGVGGAIYNANGSTLLLSSNILAGNTLGSGAASDISDGNNLIDPASDHNLLGSDSGQTVLVNAANGNFVGTTAAPLNPQLAALANNGGPTQTMLLQPMSIAIDAGANPGGLATDQRGAGFPRMLGSTVDIGAVEFDPVAPTAALLSAPAVTSASNPAAYDFTITFSDNIAVDTGTLDGADIQVTGPNGFSQLAQFVSVDTATDGTPRVATYRITPPGGTWDAADAGSYAIALLAGQVKDPQGNAAAAATLGTFLVNFGGGGPTGPLDPNGDIDGDNFTNGWEEALGTDPRNPGARPFGLGVPLTGGEMSVRRLLVDLDFSGPGKDRIKVKGILPVKDVGFSLAGQIVILDVGGVVKAFTLDAKGRADNGSDSIRVRLGRKKGASFSAEFKSGNFASSFADEHLTADSTDKSPRLVRSVILLNNLYYQAITRKRYNVKRGKLGG